MACKVVTGSNRKSKIVASGGITEMEGSTIVVGPFRLGHSESSNDSFLDTTALVWQFLHVRHHNRTRHSVVFKYYSRKARTLPFIALKDSEQRADM